MSVAVQQSTEKTAASPPMSVAGASLFGTIYMIFGWVLVNHVIPILFWLPSAARPTETMLVLLVAAVMLGTAAWAYLWPKLMPSVPGMRAGVFFGVFMLLLGLFFVFWAWNIAEYFFEHADASIGAIVPATVGFVWALFTLRRFQKPGFAERLQRWEDMGWFSARQYKKGQGLKARRATMLGFILVAGAGIWVYFQRRHLMVGTTALEWADYWAWTIPYARENVLAVLIWPNATLPILLGAITIWFAYRLVNYPQFADFLIATEAEMNKVSWATQKRLIQDTIVVLVTVLLMAIFLYIADYLLVIVLRFLGIMRFG